MAAPSINIRLVENRKLITTTGEFWSNGKKLGTGTWKDATRFIVSVTSWGNWWVGVLVSGGMNTAVASSEQAAQTITPSHFEPFSGTNIRLDENRKLILRSGEFYGNGVLLGYGQWEGSRFIAFVAAFGDRWWVGQMVPGGMNTAAVATEQEARTITPTHFEKYSVPQPNAPGYNVALAENNKLLTTYGEFFDNGALLGLGKWLPNGRYIVQVKSWSDVWWVGVFTPGAAPAGMNTATANSEQAAQTMAPTHFEKFGGTGGGVL